ncbi:DsbA family protein [Candidatus Saccharibacteria bacterium]|nr:DsbA family protein [Candidatus Saccharibacteria bacterium]
MGDTAKIEAATVNQKCKLRMIVMMTAIVVLMISVTVLAIALTGIANDVNELKSAQTTTKVKAVDPDTLDGTRLITETDLEEDGIPDHYVGNPSAAVVVIEYEDFACSHCQALSQSAEQIHADYADQVLFIHRSFSLRFPNSDKTLRAAEAAYLLGGQTAYWAMSKLLYQDTRWLGGTVFGGQGILNDYAKTVGLDPAAFEETMSDAAVTNKISRDKSLGTRAGVAGTPSWFIDGQLVTPRDADIRAALDAALAPQPQ